jgi:hypothetical protein
VTVNSDWHPVEQWTDLFRNLGPDQALEFRDAKGNRYQTSVVDKNNGRFGIDDPTVAGRQKWTEVRVIDAPQRPPHPPMPLPEIM